MLSVSQSRSRILLVDDLALFRRMIPMRLGALGREVHAVSDAQEALAYLSQQRPDILLLDVVMPGKDGFELCRELKSDVRFQYLTVIMLTALTGAAHDRSLEAGADDYLPKKVDDVVLRIRVNLHLNLQQLRMQQPGEQPSLGAASIVVASAHPSLGSQLQAQFRMDGHDVRVESDLANLVDRLRPSDSLLVLDMAADPEQIPETMTALRSNPDFASLPVLAICEKDQMDELGAIEAMVDDVLWKPLNAKVTRFRLPLLLELAARSRKR